ncbi:MAG: PIN domain-containing protein [Chloroflexia bacterium]|nr:PIN domain-containing protein [Chloroflexia bacterium]
MRIALDTNIIAYAEGVNDDHHQDAARQLLRQLPRDSTVLPVQVLGELFNVILRKTNRSRVEARQSLLHWSDAFLLASTTPGTMVDAADLAVDHGLGIWDAVILTVAAEANCRLLLSEDMHEGFTWHGVTVTNPFAATRHPLLDSILGANGFHGGDTSIGG